MQSTEKAIYTSLKKKSITGSTDDEYIKKAYYMIRSQTMFSNWSDFAFAKIFSRLLERQKIDHEIVVTTSNLRTNLDKVAFSQELVWLGAAGRNLRARQGSGAALSRSGARSRRGSRGAGMDSHDLRLGLAGSGRVICARAGTRATAARRCPSLSCRANRSS